MSGRFISDSVQSWDIGAFARMCPMMPEAKFSTMKR
jgi:hypothetical protein